MIPLLGRLAKTLLVLFCCVASAANAAEEASIQKPEWVRNTKAPERKGLNCYLGTVSSAESREKALDGSYKNALIEVVRREFSELIKISEQSSESLRGASYSRDTVYQSDKIQFFGLSEIRESPFLEASKSGGYDAYRVLCWPPGAVETEKLRQKAEAREQTAVPTSRINEVLPQGASGPTGKLEITSSPAGATIDLNATMIGLTNAAFDHVVQGKYEIVLSKDGYDFKRENVTVVAGRTTKLHMKLERIKSKISVVSDPSGARIYVNNKPMNLTTPAEFEEESEKDLDIKIEMDDYQTERRTVKVLDRPQTEKFTMSFLPGKILVRSRPEKADVWLDGKKVGKTPFPKTVAGGSHSLVLKKAGWADYAQDIEVRASRPQTLTLIMNAPNAQTETDQLGNNELLKEKPENTLLQEEPVSTPHVQNQSSNYRYSILSTVLTVAALAVGGYFSAMETVSYSLYQDAETASDAVKYRNETNANARKASISYGIAGGLLGVTILCYKFEL